MLKSIKNDLVYLLGILQSIAKIRKYSENHNTPEELFNVNDQLNFNACLNLLANIGENANKLSEELKKKYTDLEWAKIIGFRNRIVHDYKSIDIYRTFEIIKNDLPGFELKLFNIVAKGIKIRDFNIDEYLAAKQSEFYRFIDFSRIDINI